MTRPVRNMDFELFKKIVGQLSSIKPHTVVPFFYGEILLLKQFDKYLSYLCSNYKGEIAINTNGSMLTDENIDKLLALPLREITVSIDAFTSNTFKKIRTKLDLDQVTAGLSKLIARRDELNSPVKIYVFFVKMSLNEHEESAFRKYWQDKVDWLSVSDYSLYHSTVPDLRTEEQKKSRVNKLKFPCPVLWTTMVIDSMGNCVPCCLDFDSEVKCGNAEEHDLVSIFNNDTYKKLRSHHLRHAFSEISICSDCNFYEIPNFHYLFFSKIPLLRKMF
jgi:radical SAM protein with 4Fe4S-binding SPASM domain